MKKTLSICLFTLALFSSSVASATNTEAVCHTPPPHDFTIYVDSHAVAAHIAHGDYLGECIDDDNNVTTTTNTTSTTLEPCEDVPIIDDPAYLNFTTNQFFVHGRIQPTDPVEISGIAATLFTEQDGVFLAIGCPLVQVNGKLWKCAATVDKNLVYAVVKKRYSKYIGLYYAFKIKGFPTYEVPTTKLITTRVSFTCNGGENTAFWKGEIGDKITNKF